MNRDALRAQGVHYPEELTVAPYNGHHGLAAALGVNPWAFPDEELGNTDAILAGLDKNDAGTVVLSTEGLFEVLPEGWTRLLGSFKERQLGIVLHLRRWSETYPSRWQEEAKAGPVPPFAEYLVRRLQATASHLHIASHLRIVSRFAGLVGRDRLHLVVLAETSTDPFDTFCEHLLGIRTPPERPDRTGGNTSLSVAATEMLRQLQHRDEGTTPDLFLRFQQLRARDDPALTDLEITIAAQAGTTEPVRLDWLDRFHEPAEAQLFEQFRDRIVNHHGGDTLFRPLNTNERAARGTQTAEIDRDPARQRAIDSLLVALRELG